MEGNQRIMDIFLYFTDPQYLPSQLMKKKYSSKIKNTCKLEMASTCQDHDPPSTNIISASHGRESEKYRLIVVFYAPPVSPISTHEKDIK